MATKLKSPLKWQQMCSERTRLFVEKGIISTEEFLEMVKAVNREMKSKAE